MKNKSDIIKNLEKDFFSNEQLRNVKIRDNNEKLVDLKNICSAIKLAPQRENIGITGNTIYLRSAVAEKLKNIQIRLMRKLLGLKITDGYRPIEIQIQYYEEFFLKNRKKHPDLIEQELEDLSSIFCAKPELSLHPTGGAVDLTVVNLETGEELEMGTKIDVFTKKAYSFYPFLNKAILKNRRILFQEMDKEGFYNLTSEWWHFSYGTIDWALYFNKPRAIYGIKKFKK